MCKIRLDVFLAKFSFVGELNLFSLTKFENVTSHRIARRKITRQNATIVHAYRVGSQNSHQEAFKSAI